MLTECDVWCWSVHCILSVFVQSTVRLFQRWIGFLLITLRVIMAQSKEEVVLSRLEELGLTMVIYKNTVKQHRYDGLTQVTNAAEQTQQLNANSSDVYAASSLPEEILARWLYCLTLLYCAYWLYRATDDWPSSNSFNTICYFGCLMRYLFVGKQNP